jgi:hypothetical protein
VPAAIVVLAAIALLVQWWRDASAAAAERAAVLAAAESAAAASPPDAQELSRVMARLQQLPDSDSARDLLAAAARVELARDRSDRAFALFASLATQPGASADEQRLGAAILLRQHEAAAGDQSSAAGLLRQALALADSAGAGGTDADLLRGWQAASRLGDAEAKARFAALLRDRHGDSPAARLLQVVDSFDPKMPLADLEALRAEFPSVPAELDAMRVLVVLQGGDVRGAVEAADALLRRAPGLFAARMAAMAVFHACALGHAAESAERQHWIDRRNGQLDWLLARAGGEDPNRGRWEAMRASR